MNFAREHAPGRFRKTSELRDQWNALVRQMERPEVFYTWEWARAVERAYQSSLKPLLLLGHEGDTLAGVVALATDEAGKQISFLAGSTADYCDFICSPADERSSWRRFSQNWRSFMRQFCGWQICRPTRPHRGS